MEGQSWAVIFAFSLPTGPRDLAEARMFPELPPPPYPEGRLRESMVRIGRDVALQDVDGLVVIFQQRPLVRFDGKQE